MLALELGDTMGTELGLSCSLGSCKPQKIPFDERPEHTVRMMTSLIFFPTSKTTLLNPFALANT